MAFPTTPNVVTIELYYNSTWNDITSYVYHRGGSPITITRGRANEGRRVDPGKLTCEINNRDGRFSPRNPNSALFGLIGRNTPIRVSVTYSAVTYVRFVGEITSWPSRWDVSGRDIWIPVEAYGILKRLGQQQKPIHSALYRAIAGLGTNDYRPQEYWPCEDGEGSAQIASALAGHTAVRPSGPVTFAVDGPVGSSLLMQADAGFTAAFPVSAYTDAQQWVISLMVNVPTEPGGTSTLMRVPVSGGTVAEFRLEFVPGSPASVVWHGYDSTGSSIAAQTVTILIDGSLAPAESGFFGNWMMINAGSYQDSGNTFALLGVADGSIDFLGYDTASTPGTTGKLSYIKLSVDSNLDGIGLGHLAVFTDANFDAASEATTNALALGGWAGDEASDRFARICDQEQIPYALTGSSTALMGPERIVTRLEALRDCEDTDQGILMERRDALGLRLRANVSRYNQVPVELGYDQGHVSPPFDPEPDDFAVANDREVKRRNGSSARHELNTGTLSTSDPPDGVGRYDDSITVDALTDDQVDHIAGWRLHIGTWDEARYPRVLVDLAANPDLIPTVVPLESGDHVKITGLPSWLPPADAELLVEGYQEKIAFYDWDLVYNLSPAGPYNVVGVWGLMAQVLHSAVNSSATSLDIATTDTTQPMLATTALGSGYSITVGGEEMQVTAVADSAPTFGNTGTASTGSSGSRTPGLPTGSASGNLILIFASTRNSGTGTVDTPTSWTRLAIFPSTANCQVFARIYDGIWSMPTVTYTAGAANEDTIAQSLRLGGKWHDASKVLIASASCLNTSAQNITYPGLPKPSHDPAIYLYFGWKQDDYTSSSSTPTEIQEASSTAGNDASQIWAYSLPVGATAVASGVFTITGGASAISRGAVAVLRPDYQTATVTRSLNGVSASHSAGDAVTATKPMRWGLV